MRVIVTGGLGYLGSHVVWNLLKAGHHPITVDFSLPGLRRPLFPGEEFLQADILGTLDAARGILKDADAVIHLAALIDAPKSVQTPELYYKVNFIGTLNVLELARDLGASKFLLASSAAVYGAGCTSPLEEHMATPTPENPYGGTKLFGETLAADVCRARGMAYANLRLFNLVGVNPEVGVAPQNKGLFSVVVDAVIHQKKFLNLYGSDHPTEDGSCVRDFVYVDDVAKAFLRALTADAPALTLNVGTGQGTSVRKVLKAGWSVGARGGVYSIVTMPKREGEVSVSVANVDLIQKLGWKASNLAVDDYLDQEYSAKHST